MKKSLTSTYQSFLLHSMLTLMTAQATHATEPLMNFLDALQHCNNLEEVENVGENTKKNLIDKANDYFKKGMMHAAKKNKKGNEEAVKAFNKAISKYQAVKGHERDIVSAAYQLATVRINMKKPENALSAVKKVLKLYGNVTTEPADLIPLFKKLASICRYDLKENNLAIQYYLKVINLCNIECSCADEKIKAYFHLGGLYIEEGKQKAAIEYYKKVIQEAKPESVLVAHAQNQLGNIYTKKHYLDHNQAEQCYLSALSIYKGGNDNFFLAETKLNLAIFYLDKQKDYDKAIKSFEGAIDYYSKVDTQNPKTKRKIAVIYFKLANAYQFKQKYKLAIGAFNKAIFFYKELGDTLSVAKAKFNIALCHEKDKQRPLAEDNYKEARKLFRIEKEAAYIAQCDKKLGDLYLMQKGREKEALPLYKKFYKAYRASDHLSKKICAVKCLAKVYLKLNDYKKTIERQEEALKLFPGKYGKNSLKEAELCDDLGRTCYVAEQWGNAIKYHKKALKIRKTNFPEDDIDLAVAYTNLSTAYLQNEDYKEARENAEEALNILENHKEKNDETIIRNRLNIAYTYEQEKDYEKAKKHFDKALKLSIDHFGADHLSTAKVYEDIGVLYLTQKKMKEAYPMYKEALNIRENPSNYNASEITKNYTTMGDICYHIKEYFEAIEVYSKAIQIFGEKKTLAAARAYNSRGSAYGEKGLYDAAIEDHKKAKEIFDFKKEKEGVIVTCKLLGHCYSETKQYGEAIKSYRTVLKKHKELRANAAEIANDYYEIGVCYSYSDKNNKYTYAIKNHNEALTNLEKYYGAKGMEVAYKCTDIGEVYSSLKQYKLAELFYERSLKIRKKHPKKQLALKKGYLSMGVNSYRLGNYKEVTKYFPKYFAIKEEDANKFDKNIITLRAILSDAFFINEQYVKSINAAEEGLEKLKLFSLLESKEIKLQKAKFLHNICRAACCLKKYEIALENCERALEIHKEECEEKDKRIAKDLYFMGLIHKNLLPGANAREQYSQGILYYQKAQKIYEYHESAKDLKDPKDPENLENLKYSKKCEIGICGLKTMLSSLDKMPLFIQRQMLSAPIRS